MALWSEDPGNGSRPGHDTESADRREFLSRRRLVAFVIGFFTAVGLANAAQIYISAEASGGHMTPAGALLHTLPFWWVKAALIPLVAVAARRLPPFGRRWWWRTPIHVGFSLAFGAIPLAVGGGLLVLLDPGVGTLGPVLGELLSSFLVAGASIYWLLLAAVQALDYYERYRDRELLAARLAQRSARLEADLTAARLDTLRMRLNPHFLYNTLNSVSVLALKGDGQRVVHMLDELAGVLRHTLESTEGLVGLAEELDLVDRYLRIEQVRFGDRLRIARCVDAEALDALVPSLVLQPLVENAIKHGVGARPGPVAVEVGARVRDGRLELWVADSGPGFGRPAMTGQGVGLRTTRLRLDALYGEAAEVQCSASGPGARVLLTLPYERHKPPGVPGRAPADAVGALP